MARLIDHYHKSYLCGKLLVATPGIDKNSFFSKSLIYIISNNNEGTIGIVVNQPIKNIEANDLFKALGLDIKLEQKIPIHLGGPNDAERGFILHSSEAKNLNEAQSKLSISSNFESMTNLLSSKKANKTLFALGYSGWEYGQLEKEIKNNDWLLIPFCEQLIFAQDNNLKWQKAMSSIGINPALLTSAITNV